MAGAAEVQVAERDCGGRRVLSQSGRGCLLETKIVLELCVRFCLFEPCNRRDAGEKDGRESERRSNAVQTKRV